LADFKGALCTVPSGARPVDPVRAFVIG